MSLVVFPFRNDTSSFPDISICIQYLFFRPNMFPTFTIKHISGGRFHPRFLQHLPLTKYQMDMIIGFHFVVMKCYTALDSVLGMKIFSEQPHHFFGRVFDILFRQCNDQFSALNAPTFRSACCKILLIFSCEILPKLQRCSIRLVHGI